MNQKAFRTPTLLSQTRYKRVLYTEHLDPTSAFSNIRGFSLKFEVELP